MNDTIKSITLSTYEQVCSQCIDDLYHVAYLAFVDADEAERLVTRICVAGVYKYSGIKDEGVIRYHLTADLYRCCRRKLWFVTPQTEALPEPLRILSKKERLVIAMHFASGLSAADTGSIVGMKSDVYRKTVSAITDKILLPADMAGAGTNRNVNSSE